MLRNYHTHTSLCNHARGTMEEYVRRAIDRGLLTLGFSDHTPYTYPEGYASRSKMKLSEMGFYFDTLLSLREKYRDHIEIPIGFEAEYYPAYFDSLLAEYRKYPLDYLIYAGHFIGNEPDAFFAFEMTDDPGRLTAYVDHSVAAISTGRFSAIAHPDCLCFVGSEELYREEMRRLISAAMDMGLPLEINMCGMREGRHYPTPAFWEEAAAMGATAILGMDCHRVEQVADPDEIAAAHRFADRLGIEVIDELKLIDPLF